jgi:hypothetical protein
VTFIIHSLNKQFKQSTQKEGQVKDKEADLKRTAFKWYLIELATLS